MNKFQWWLLRKLIRKVLTTFSLQQLMSILWEEHQSVFYEDNSATRWSHIENELVHTAITKGLYHPRPRFRD